MTNKSKIDLTTFPQLSFKNNVLIFNEVLFLYQSHESCQFQYLLGNKKVDQENIDIFQSNIESNINLSKRYGFLYKHIVFPAKATSFKPRFKNLGLNIQSLFSKDHENNAVYYPQLKNMDFHKEDTHCNIFGDLKIIYAILEEFFPNTVLPNPILKNEVHKLDLARNIDDNYLGSQIQVLIGVNNITTKKQKNYSIANALSGSSGTVSYAKNPNAYYNKRILLFGDSCFQQIMWDVFCSLFSEVIFFRNPYVMEDIVMTLQPDIVLSCNAERYLIAVPNAQRPIPWFLHYLSPETFNTQKVDKETFNELVKLFVIKRKA